MGSELVTNASCTSQFAKKHVGDKLTAEELSALKNLAELSRGAKSLADVKDIAGKLAHLAEKADEVEAAGARSAPSQRRKAGAIVWRCRAPTSRGLGWCGTQRRTARL
jgi:hypothetical protein